MPIVIRELVIRARLEETDSACHTNGAAQKGQRSTLQNAEIEQIVALCAEKVMETLERKKER